jgi:CRISPR-associated endonuclease Csn1
MSVKTTTPLTIGLDIGIASVGWAVLAPDRIVNLGVRAFDKAETAKEGESLNLARRTARLMRRRLRRRAWRLTRLARLMKREGLIDSARLFREQAPFHQSVWGLRVAGLDRRLADEEWARVVYHLCKHRGFHWFNRAEEKQADADSKGEGGKVKQGLAATARLMSEKGYRTAAEMVLSEFPEAQRNKQGDYSKALSRKLLGQELSLLFRRQREMGNPHAGEALERSVLGDGDQKSGLFWLQKPDLLRMIGKCTFEKQEDRAPKASFTAERHVWLTRLNNLRIVVDGQVRPLNGEERRIALSLPYQSGEKFKYRQLRSALVKSGLTDSFKFAGLRYPVGRDGQDAGKAKDPEEAALASLPAWHELRLSLKRNGLESEWHSISGPALEGHPELLDQIAWVLSVYKDDEEVKRELRKLSLPGDAKLIETLLEVRFSKFHSLSLKALRRIVPYMEVGLRYDEACEKAHYRHSQPADTNQARLQYLPPLYSGRDKDGRMLFNEALDIPRNPVVLRALNQARKVVNALIRTYGSPTAVHIEMARDLSRPLDERRKIEKEQLEYRDRNQKDKAVFEEQFHRLPSGLEFEKWRLYREQQGKCAYSVTPIDIERLTEPGYVEIDHALPYSRSFDDSKNNKVLVHAKENREKGNRTPYEYLGGTDESPRWRLFVAFVESNKAYRLAKRTRLLRKGFDDEAAAEFRDRNLNDTRYICRFFKNFVDNHLQFAGDEDRTRCVVVSGQLTAFLRARWGLVKVRGDNDRHHALDAAVVAACSRSMVKRLSDYARRKELGNVRQGFVDATTGEIVDTAMFEQLERHFPDPWPHFRSELVARLTIDDPAKLQSDISMLGSYPSEELTALKPLFVSRAPQRRNGGAAHKETIYARPERLASEGAVTQKVALSSLTLADVEKLVDPHRNKKLYSAIRARLEQYGGKGEKAFPPDNPMRKPDSEGNPTGPVVRSVTMVIDKLSGIPVRGGVAKNDTMLRVDVFSKDAKFFLVPVYVHHRAVGLPNRAIVAYKPEAMWVEMDASFVWKFSLYPNDLVRISLKGIAHFGYFAGCDRANGSVSLWSHDRNRFAGRDGLIRGIGVKTALSVEKFDVDVLGNVFPAPSTGRRDLA